MSCAMVSGYLLACYDPENEEFQGICKIGTGFKDDDLKNFTEQLSEHIIENPPRYYTFPENSRPDVWFSPVTVWEVMAADLSLSPAYKAAVGLVDPTRGISLRFPRYLRTRTDKEPEQATTAEQVAEMYNNQAVIQNQQKSGVGGGSGNAAALLAAADGDDY